MGRRLPPMPTISEIIRLYKLSAKKHLSQNFLLDVNVVRRLLKCAAPLADSNVVEVGPGPGCITREILAKQVKQLHVIEKDDRFLPALNLLNKTTGNDLTVHLGDVLHFDMSRLFGDELANPWDGECPNIQLIGNLPFNVSTPLIIQYMSAISEKKGLWRYGRVPLTLTFQREVGERMTAKKGGYQRSRLSIMTQNWCEVALKYTIPGKSFVPAPDVNVAVMHMTPRIQPRIALPFPLVNKVVRAVFHYRQKHCFKGVQTLFPQELGDAWQEMFTRTEIDRTTSSQFLTMKDFSDLCHVYADLCAKHKGLLEYDYRQPQQNQNSNSVSRQQPSV